MNLIEQLNRTRELAGLSPLSEAAGATLSAQSVWDSLIKTMIDNDKKDKAQNKDSKDKVPNVIRPSNDQVKRGLKHIAALQANGAKFDKAMIKNYVADADGKFHKSVSQSSDEFKLFQILDDVYVQHGNGPNSIDEAKKSFTPELYDEITKLLSAKFKKNPQSGKSADLYDVPNSELIVAVQRGSDLLVSVAFEQRKGVIHSLGNFPDEQIYKDAQKKFGIKKMTSRSGFMSDDPLAFVKKIAA